jgi:sigma-B regulation protein RsbU (phosphoserine phosphatase)
MRIDLTTDGGDASSTNPAPMPPPDQDRHPDSSKECRLVGSEDFRELLQSIYDASIITDTDGYIISCNERAVQFFKYDLKDLAGLHVTKLISGSDHLLVDTIKESLQNDRFILIQAFCSRSDGTLFPAEVSANFIKISGENYLCLFIRDVTLRKEAEDRLRTGHVAIQNSGNGIAITDLSATLQYFNPAMVRLLGAEDEEQISDANITSFMHNADKVDQIVSSVMRGKTWSGELEMLCFDDSTIFVQASVAPNTNSDGTIVGMVWSLLDVSEQKRIQLELQERNSQMEEDLSLAREFQQAFIQAEYPIFPPQGPPDESAINFGHAYLPSGAVGGDFFEIFAVSDTKAGIFISDVMGHGVRSALVVATIRGLIEELGSLRDNPAAFISHMNRDLTRIIKHHGHVTFATAFYMTIDLTDGSIIYTSAGHPGPFLLHAQDQTAEMLKPDTGSLGPALGIFDSTAYEQATTRMQAGDTIVLYTDGVFEAENPDTCEAYETERVAQTLTSNMGLPPKEILDRLIEDVHNFCGREYFDDDVCLIAATLKQLITPDASA